MDDLSTPNPHVILIVQPNRNTSSLVSSVLTRIGYAVLEASTSEEALQICSEISGINLIITDIFLPGASGIDLVARLLRDQPAMKVLYLSSIAESALRKQGIGELASVLVKPLALSDLLSAVNQLLGTLPSRGQ